MFPVRPILSIGISTLLLCAAFLKLQTFLYDPLWSYRFTYPAFLAAITVQLEIIVGLFVLKDRLRGPSWMMAISLFTCFMLTSIWMSIAGWESCGCFGSVELSPFISLAINAAIVSLLFWSRCQYADTSSELRKAERQKNAGKEKLAGRVFGYAVSILVVAFLIGTTQGRQTIFGKRDQPVSISPILLANAEHGVPINLQVSIWNNSTTDAKVIGGGVSCSCITLNDFPFEIPAGSRKEVELTYIHNKKRDSKYGFVFFMEHNNQYSVSGTIRIESQKKRAL